MSNTIDRRFQQRFESIEFDQDNAIRVQPKVDQAGSRHPFFALAVGDTLPEQRRIRAGASRK